MEMTKSEEVAGEVELERRRRCEEDLEEIISWKKSRVGLEGEGQMWVSFSQPYFFKGPSQLFLWAESDVWPGSEAYQTP